MQTVVDPLVEAIQREKSDRLLPKADGRALGRQGPGELDFTYDFYANEVPAPEMPDTEQINSNIKALSASNPKVKTVNAAALVDQSFVKNAQSAAKKSGATASH